MMNYHHSKQNGVESETEWSFCTKTNTTFMDCPELKNTTYLSVYNPSSLSLSHGEVMVDDGHYELF